jgi:hypothetical protein
MTKAETSGFAGPRLQGRGRSSRLKIQSYDLEGEITGNFEND